ncbi:MAG: type II toxin-antitoxin system prevent-host-death family antitoxin, partial [Pseudomonadota bacterium]
NIHHAKTHLSQLIAKALEGEEVVIGKAGNPLVRLVPLVQPIPRVAGKCKGKIVLAEDFDSLPPEFEGF